MKYRLGIDLGGTSAKIALVNEDKQIVKGGLVSTANRPTPQNLINTLARLCRTFMRGKKITQVGIGVAGDVDFKRGEVRVSPNLGWRKVPLKLMLVQKLHVPVVVDNDANVAALGIYSTQVPRRIKHMIVVTLGTGVGGGIILNGQVYRGASGSAGEIGHMTMVENGRPCNCGQLGCLESYTGGRYMVREVKEALEMGQTSQLRALFEQDPDQISPLAISQAARNGDRYSRTVWNDAGRMLGRAIGNLIYIFNPQLIYLTGGVAQVKDLILRPIRKSLKERAYQDPIRGVRIRVAEKAAHAGAIGASLL